jgi:hypothetical protein
MRNWKFRFIILLTCQAAMAQELVPATSEDLQDFDRQVSRLKQEAAAKRAGDRPDRSDLGAMIKDEATKLKDADKDDRKDFGKWVSGQRKKNVQGRPTAEGSFGVHHSRSNGRRGESSSPDHSKGKRPK